MKTRSSIAQLTAETWIIIDLSFKNRETGGAAFLAGVTEGLTHQVFDGEFTIRLRRDDQRVLPARLSIERQ